MNTRRSRRRHRLSRQALQPFDLLKLATAALARDMKRLRRRRAGAGESAGQRRTQSAKRPAKRGGSLRTHGASGQRGCLRLEHRRRQHLPTRTACCAPWPTIAPATPQRGRLARAHPSGGPRALRRALRDHFKAHRAFRVRLALPRGRWRVALGRQRRRYPRRRRARAPL